MIMLSKSHDETRTVSDENWNVGATYSCTMDLRNDPININFLRTRLQIKRMRRDGSITT